MKRIKVAAHTRGVPKLVKTPMPKVKAAPTRLKTPSVHMPPVTVPKTPRPESRVVPDRVAPQVPMGPQAMPAITPKAAPPRVAGRPAINLASLLAAFKR